MSKKQEILLENIIQYYVEYSNLTEEESNEIVYLRKDLKSFGY